MDINISGYSKELVIDAGDYYGKDGLLYCGKCGTPRQVRINICGAEYLQTCLCRCRTYARDAEEARLKLNDIKDTYAKMKSNCFIGMPIKNLVPPESLKGINEAAKRACCKFVECWDEIKGNNIGMMLYGNPGTGKTYTAACMANALIDKGVPVLMRKMDYFLNASFERKAEKIDEITKCDLFILDDLGAERCTAYGLENVFTVIDTCYQRRKPTIITTNINPEFLINPQSTDHERIYSRVMEMCFPVFFDGDGMRQSIQRDKMAQFKAMMGAQK